MLRLEPMDTINTLIIGNGGREHALGWKLRQSPRCRTLYASRGNPGIARVGECVRLKLSDPEGIVRFCREKEVGLVVVGPEAPLAEGLADRMRETGVPVFGPSAAAARIESSKAYAREIMTRMGVPQPDHERFTDYRSASAYLDALAAHGAQGAVVKASGLAAGKGAIVCDTLDAAREAAREMLEESAFGTAGEEILIEERLTGEEASLFVLTDGESAVPLVPAQDYKRAFDGDLGPNTGGMGSYAPAPVLSPELCEEAMRTVVRPTLRGLAEDGAPFQGCLYAGLMKTADGLKVIEFNCRFGDPETQAVLPLLESDLLELFLAAAEGRLGQPELRWKPGCAVTVTLASGGYPDAYASGKPIEGLEEAEALPDVLVFHAGTAEQGGEIVTAGGRVLAVTGLGTDFGAAAAAAYGGVERIRFEGRHYRTDIAARFIGRGTAAAGR